MWFFFLEFCYTAGFFRTRNLYSLLHDPLRPVPDSAFSASSSAASNSASYARLRQGEKLDWWKLGLGIWWKYDLSVNRLF